MRSSSTKTSMSPVGILSVFALLSLTVPLASSTYSLFADAAFSKTALSVVSSNASWMIPVLSRRSMNIRPPRSLILCTQPKTVISSLSEVSAVVCSFHSCYKFHYSLPPLIRVRSCKLSAPKPPSAAFIDTCIKSSVKVSRDTSVISPVSIFLTFAV